MTSRRCASTSIKGDVLLVEGDQRVSVLIKYLTQSSWSHAALYVGDELVRRGGELAAFALEASETSARSHVEALYDGVVASPLDKYVAFNVRFARRTDCGGPPADHPRRRDRDHRLALRPAPHARPRRCDCRWWLATGRFSLEERRLGGGMKSAVIRTSPLAAFFRKVRLPCFRR